MNGAAKKNNVRPETVKEQSSHYGPDSERYEVIDGVRYDMLPSPRLDHQILVTEIFRALYQTCHQSGLVVVAPMDVNLDPSNTVQPDVIFISEQTQHIIRDRQIFGAPDLLVEILSPSSGAHDKIRKKRLYERFGVKEYWIVAPAYRTIDQYVWTGGTLQLTATYGPGDRLTSTVIACADIDLESLFLPLNRFGYSE